MELELLFHFKRNYSFDWKNKQCPELDNGYLSDDGGGMGWNGDPDLNDALGLSNTFNATV